MMQLISHKKTLPIRQRCLAICILTFLFAIQNISGQGEIKFDHVTVNDGLPQNTVYSISKDKFGFMWFGTWAGAVKYDGYNFKVYRVGDPHAKGLPDNKILAIVTDSLKDLWILTDNSKFLVKYNYEKDNFKRVLFAKASDEVKRLITIQRAHSKPVQYREHTAWSFNQQGLIRKDLHTGVTRLYKSNVDDPFSINDNQIFNIYLDDCDNLWIGTKNGGVNHANLRSKPFKLYQKDQNGNQLADHIVRAICKDKQDRLWIGSEGSGITIIKKNGEKSQYSYIDIDKLPSPKVRSLLCDNIGNIWIGTKGGLVVYNNKTQSIDPIREIKSNVFALFQDHNKIIWIGTFNGLWSYNPDTKALLHFDPLKTTVGNQIRCIIEDKFNNLWIGTEDKGVTRLSNNTTNSTIANLKPVNFKHSLTTNNSLVNDHVYSLAMDLNGNIWIATNNGVSILNPRNNSFRNLTSSEGLPDNSVVGILSDNNGKMWISHKKGLTCVNDTTLDMINFNMYDKLQGLEFCQNACFKDPESGELYFGGTNGMNSFYPDRISINNIKPQTVITKLTVMNQLVEPGMLINKRVILSNTISCTKEIVLTWWDKTFALEFAALHYANPQGNKYKYRLEGYEKDWIFADASRRNIWYSKLPSGNYRFVVYGANSDGVWSEKPAVLNIVILPPWWLTWWAITLYVAIGIVVFLLILTYFKSRIEIKKNEEIHQAKLKFFTEVSHEFRTPLTLIIDPLEKIIKEEMAGDIIKKYCIVMHRNAKQLLMLINQLLDLRKLESGHLELTSGQYDIVSFVKVVASSFDFIAQERKMNYKILTSVDELVVSFDRYKMNMILNNLISNAFKFTPDKGGVEVNLSLSENQQEVIISVSDTGNGIAENELSKVFEMFYQSEKKSTWQAGSGVGLALTKELVLLHNGRIDVKSELGKGTCFTVFLPIENSIDTAFSNQHEDEELLVGEDSIIFEDSKGLNKSSELPLLLVVDDNIDIRNYIELNLSESYHVLKASNGRKGFEIAIDVIPDIIISDIMMPEMDGLELCRALKTDQKTSHIPVILLTAKQSDQSRVEGYETGADSYLTKPFSTEVLSAQVRNLLNQRQRLRELFQSGTELEIKKIAINITDEAFLNKVIHLVHENIEDENFNINLLAEHLSMSRSQFYRKIKALTNQSLLDFVTTIRMNKALEYLLSGEYNISETAYKVGFSMHSNFTRTFTKHFSVSPSKYIESMKK